ncbi:MAG: Gfo/Idh/MocA family oxidoreductase, partial [Alphaproteobacteria bacterium]
MAERRLGLIMHGVTGRMGYNQHLVRSILAIRDQGGLVLANGDRLMPDPIIVGRDREKIQRLADKHHIQRWSTDLDEALANPDDTVFFDAGTTQMRAELLSRAIDAGKHVYCEKPVSDDLDTAIALARKAKAAGIKHGVVQDKL